MNNELSPWLRRSLLQTVAGLALSPMVAAAPAPAGAGGGSATPIEPPPGGRPGEFDFLTGNWRIRNQRLKDAERNEWDRFDSEASCWSILGGVASIEELRIPSRNFSGMGMRLFNDASRTWFELWTNAKGATLVGPGTPGGFRDGVAIFEADDVDGELPIRVRSTWDRITSRSCRWQQAVSRDGGRHWQANWIMEWERA